MTMHESDTNVITDPTTQVAIAGGSPFGSGGSPSYCHPPYSISLEQASGIGKTRQAIRDDAVNAEDKERRGYVSIPMIVLTCPALTNNEKCLYAFNLEKCYSIKDGDDKTMSYWGPGAIGKSLGISKATVIRSRQHLHQVGFMYTVNRGKTNNGDDKTAGYVFPLASSVCNHQCSQCRHIANHKRNNRPTKTTTP